MKYLKVNLGSIKIKGDPEDMETLGVDIHERVAAMAEAGTLDWEIDWDNEEDDED